MACFPVSARFAKMLVLSEQHDLLPFTVCLVAALSVQEVLLENPISAEDKEQVTAPALWPHVMLHCLGLSEIGLCEHVLFLCLGLVGLGCVNGSHVVRLIGM